MNNADKFFLENGFYVATSDPNNQTKYISNSMNNTDKLNLICLLE